MPHGAPDDSDVVKRGDNYRLDDMAELAARLGSPVTFHRFGDVVWIDTFETGLGGWVVGATDPASVVYLQGDNCMMGGCAVEIASAAEDPEYARIAKGYTYEVGTRIGFGTCYAINGDSTNLTLQILYRDGVHAFAGTIRITHSSGLVEYVDDIGDRVTLGNVGLLDVTGVIWYPIKLIVDTNTGTYVGFTFGSHQFNMTDIAMLSTVSALAPMCSANLQYRCADALAHSLYIDNCVFTVNEF